MWFKNKETGFVWDVVDETHINRCKNDPNYEQVSKPNKKTSSEQEQDQDEKPKQTKKKSPKKK